MTRVLRVLLPAVLAGAAVFGAQGCASARPSPGTGAVPGGWPIAPAKATVTSAFGERRGGSRHHGIDLSAPAGTKIWTTADGTVTFAGRESGFGRNVVVDHGDGWQTRYAHLKRIKVERGDRLRRGDLIGTVGRSGNARGAHLHYEIIRDGVPLDPRPYLDR